MNRIRTFDNPIKGCKGVMIPNIFRDNRALEFDIVFRQHRVSEGSKIPVPTRWSMSPPSRGRRSECLDRRGKNSIKGGKRLDSSGPIQDTRSCQARINGGGLGPRHSMSKRSHGKFTVSRPLEARVSGGSRLSFTFLLRPALRWPVLGYPCPGTHGVLD